MSTGSVHTPLEQVCTALGECVKQTVVGVLPVIALPSSLTARTTSPVETISHLPEDCDHSALLHGRACNLKVGGLGVGLPASPVLVQ